MSAIVCRPASGHAMVEPRKVGRIVKAEFTADLRRGGIGEPQQAVGFEREAAVDDIERRATEVSGGKA